MRELVGVTLDGDFLWLAVEVPDHDVREAAFLANLQDDTALRVKVFIERFGAYAEMVHDLPMEMYRWAGFTEQDLRDMDELVDKNDHGVGFESLAAFIERSL